MYDFIYCSKTMNWNPNFRKPNPMSCVTIEKEYGFSFKVTRLHHEES